MINQVYFSASESTQNKINKKTQQAQKKARIKPVEKTDTVEIKNKKDPKQKIIVTEETFNLLSKLLKEITTPSGTARACEGGGGTN